MLVTRLHDAFYALQPQFLEFRAIGLLRSQLVHVVGFPGKRANLLPAQNT